MAKKNAHVDNNQDIRRAVRKIIEPAGYLLKITR